MCLIFISLVKSFGVHITVRGARTLGGRGVGTSYGT